MTDSRRDAVSLGVARNVVNLRRARGWHLRQLSDRCAASGKRIAISRLSRIETAADGSRTLEISVDDLVALATAFETPVEQLLTPWEPKCSACLDSPPTGFACRTCGAEA
mgnify:CR=1 FL=1